MFICSCKFKPTAKQWERVAAGKKAVGALPDSEYNSLKV
jgi:hypothetical protein